MGRARAGADAAALDMAARSLRSALARHPSAIPWQSPRWQPGCVASSTQTAPCSHLALDGGLPRGAEEPAARPRAHRNINAVGSPIHSARMVHFEQDPGDPSRCLALRGGSRVPLAAFLAEHDIVVNCVLQDDHGWP